MTKASFLGDGDSIADVAGEGKGRRAEGEGALQQLTTAHRESKVLRAMVDGVYRYTGKLQELWDASLQEGLDKGKDDQSGGATEMVEGQEVKYSPRNNSIIEEQPYHTEQQKRIIEEYNEAVDYEMLEAAQLYEDNPGANDQRIVTSVANAREIEDIKKLTGQDVTGYRHTANRSFFTHVAKRHGVNGEAVGENKYRRLWLISAYIKKPPRMNHRA